jgi:hypothetical protein
MQLWGTQKTLKGYTFFYKALQPPLAGFFVLYTLSIELGLIGGEQAVAVNLKALQRELHEAQRWH